MSREMALRRLPLILAFCAGLAVLAGFSVAGPSAETGVHESKACLDCHDGMDATLVGTAHRVTGDGARVACTDCHAGPSAHWEDDPEKNPMPNPGKMTSIAEARVCTQCHENSHQQNMLEKNVHAANNIACSACHSVHGSKQYSLLRKPENQLCESCHVRVAGEFARPYRHPIEEGVIKCTECHMTLDRTTRPLSKNGTNVCLKCHGELAGPFPYEHQATLDHSTEEGGCISCHDPHGSSLPRMLKQPYEPPHQQLCTQCHSIPPKHLSNPMHGTRWNGMACNECHTDIHGSYDNRWLLSTSLRAQGCLNRACHGR
jgi:DmsE family decaheme c-type cytochrome